MGLTQIYLGLTWSENPGVVKLDNFGYEEFVDYITADMTCMPESGALPLATNFIGVITNNYPGSSRDIAYIIDVTTGGGYFITDWRSGISNVASGESNIFSWNLTIPSLPSLFGSNNFQLITEDVTSSPFNQPPYPPAGETDTGTCTIEGNIVSAELVCSPLSGTLPFDLTVSMTMTNLYTVLPRRFAYHIDAVTVTAPYIQTGKMVLPTSLRRTVILNPGYKRCRRISLFSDRTSLRFSLRM